MMSAYYGKVLEDLLCPNCGRPMETTSRAGGWSVDCQFMSPLSIIDGHDPCNFDYFLWNPKLFKTEEEAINAHKRKRLL